VRYKNVPVVDAHIHIHTNDSPSSRVAFHRNEEIVNEIFEKTNDEAITLVATGFARDYKFGKSGPVNLPETVVGYYLKDKMPQKIYLFGALSRNYHKPELNTPELLLEQAKFRYAAGCDGFKSLDGHLNTYRAVGARLSDPVTDLYFDYLEKNRIPINIHCANPEDVFEEGSILYAGKDRLEETVQIYRDVRADVEELLTKFPKLTLILPHFYFLSRDLDQVEAIFNRWENVYFDMTPNIFMYYDFNRYSDEYLRDFFRRNAHRLLYGTDTYIEENIRPIPIQVEVVRDFFEKEHSPFLSEMGIRTLPMDDDFLKKMYYENFVKLVGPQPRKVNRSLALEECNHLLGEYGAYLSELDREYITKIKQYFANEGLV